MRCFTDISHPFFSFDQGLELPSIRVSACQSLLSNIQDAITVPRPSRTYRPTPGRATCSTLTVCHDQPAAASGCTPTFNPKMLGARTTFGDHETWAPHYFYPALDMLAPNNRARRSIPSAHLCQRDSSWRDLQLQVDPTPIERVSAYDCYTSVISCKTRS